MARRKKMKTAEVSELEEDFVSYAHSKVVDFHPHCYNQQMELAEAKRFDEVYALAHSPVLGENEEDSD